MPVESEPTVDEATREDRLASRVRPAEVRASDPNDLSVRRILPGAFDPHRHFYPRVLNAQMHSLVQAFLSLGNDRIAERFGALNPASSTDALRALLRTSLEHFRWGGTDLFHVTTRAGVRRVIVIETNSCPSGQKSMPILEEHDAARRYRALIEGAFLPVAERRPERGLAVLYDKNLMEASGYAAALSDITRDEVFLVPMHDRTYDAPTRFAQDMTLEIRTPEGDWTRIGAAIRYVTQRPWNRIPPITRTIILNPVLACLAGGRNKLLAAKAYDLFNAELAPHGLRIRSPETFWDVGRAEIPLWVERLGGNAVVKVPYSNAGQGVYTITSPSELEALMAIEHPYNRFVVQALVGSSRWGASANIGRYTHVGTVPDAKGNVYVADLRFMVGSGPQGFFPVALYARRARSPLSALADPRTPSWDVFGTNLSRQDSADGWATETERLLLMDSRDFNRLGLGLDDLIEGYVQSVLAMTAIDRMAQKLRSAKVGFRRKFFKQLNPDMALLNEVR